MNNNIFSEALIRSFDEVGIKNLSFLDKDNILWKLHEGEWVGKKAVIKDRTHKWGEEWETQSMAI